MQLNFNLDSYHALVDRIAHNIGHHMGEETPDWLHFVMHVVLVWGPLALIILSVIYGYRLVRKKAMRRPSQGRVPAANHVSGLPNGVFGFVLRFSRRDQIALVVAGIMAMPVLYATLELPKIIINDAIASHHFPLHFLGQNMSQAEYLFALSALYLVAILANSSFKFGINIYKGQVGERLLRRLRLTIFRRWRAGAGSVRRSEVIPLIAQEVEPIGGFAADSFALPVFQGGTFLTVLVFMFVQDPVLGAAAITFLPVQLSIIPRLQRKVNRLARRRVAEVRSLGGHLGDQAGHDLRSGEEIRTIGSLVKRIETIRRRIHRSKYFIKSLNNFLTALTPFFFYSIGGYLVIEGRLSMGALVAVLAAYKDFSTPLRELFRYYQAVEDVRIRYDEMMKFLAEGRSMQEAERQRMAAQVSPRPIAANADSQQLDAIAGGV